MVDGPTVRLDPVIELEQLEDRVSVVPSRCVHGLRHGVSGWTRRVRNHGARMGRDQRGGTLQREAGERPSRGG
jgi:hypothetical protein